MQALDIEFARSRFAGLATENWAFLDNAGGSFALEATAERVADYIRETPVQLGGSYPLSQLAAQRQQQASEALRAMLNARHAEEIVIAGSASALAWRVARALLPSLQQGDEIIITRMDHEANRSPWLALRAHGIVVHELGVSRDDWSLDRAQLRSLLGPRTRMVCIGHCSNILGRIEPVADIAAEVHAAGARILVDGVAYAPHRPVDVQALDVDFYLVSLYKLFGPHAGLMYGRREALLELANINHEYLPADALPYKLQPGGASYELVYGAAAIPAYLEELDRRLDGNGDGGKAWAAIAAHEAALAGRLLQWLEQQPRVELIGPREIEARLPIISFRVEGMPCTDLVAGLEQHKVACRSGHFHAPRLLESLDIDPQDGVLRISFAHYNSEEELQRLLQALQQLLPG